MCAEPLNIEQPTALIGYLRDTGRIGCDEQPMVTPLSGGVSNRTVLVKRPSGEAWVIKQALARLRVATEWCSDPARIHREAAGLRWLARTAPVGTITPLVFEDTQQHLLAMEAVPQPHENWKVQLLAGEVRLELIDQFAALLAAIHGAVADHEVALQAEFGDRTFFESLRLEPYYAYAAANVPPAARFLNELIAATRQRRDTLVHGDYSPKNVLVRAGRIVLLDHEVIHFGDPAFDLGFATTHFLGKANHLCRQRAAFVGAAVRFWEGYCRALGSPPWAEGLEGRAVRHTLGCLLARVDGRSPLEYLTPEQRAAQRAAVLRLIAAPPGSMAELAAGFADALPPEQEI